MDKETGEAIGGVLLGVVLIGGLFYGFSAMDNAAEKRSEEARQERLNTELTNEQIVEKAKFCFDGGLGAKEIKKGNIAAGEYVVGIQCTPEKDTGVIQGKKSNATQVIIN